MNIYPIRKFIKKDTNEEIINRTLTVYDKESNIKVKLWENNQVNMPDEMGLQPGDLVKISRCYVKSGLDGKPIINLGSNGIIELISNDDSSIPNIDSKTITVDDVKEQQENVIITGNIDSNPRISEFIGIRGEKSKSLQMQISNEAHTRSLRVIIWNIDERRVKAYNETREHGGINGLTPSEIFLGRLNSNNTHLTRKQHRVTYVGNQKCNLSL
jgi:replication factor A1